MDPIPVKTAAASRPDDNYAVRALMAGALASAAQTFVAIVSRVQAANALPERILLASPTTQKETQPVLDTLDRVVDSIINGSDLSAQYPIISRLIHAQDQRAEVISQLVLTQDYRRLAKATRAREKLEDSLFTAAMNDELLPAERVVVLEMLNGVVRDTRKVIEGRSTSIADIQALLGKIDYATEVAGESLRKKFAQTSPQGREVVRKLLTGVRKKLDNATAPE